MASAKTRYNPKKSMKMARKQEDDYIKADLQVEEINWDVDDNSLDTYYDGYNNKKQKIENDSLPSFVTTDTQTDEQLFENITKLEQKTLEYGKMENRLLGGSDPFSCLADELIMKIFSYLPLSSMQKCVLVSKRWKEIGYDSTFWKTVNLDRKKILKDGLLGTILHRGVQVLRLSRAEILSPICLNDCPYMAEGEACPSFPVTHLDASVTKFTDDYLTNLLFKCESLQYLSLEGCKVGILEVTAISMNSSLEVLNLSNVIGLSVKAIDAITRRCSKLRSINIAWTNQTRDGLRHISRCKHLEELDVSGLRGGIDRVVMEKFVTSCRKMKSLDFSDVTLQIGTLKLIADNCKDLERLSISRCSDVKPEQLFELVSLPKLSHLNLFGFVNSAALTRFTDARPDIYVNKETFSPIARPISTSRYEGRLWEQYVGFII